MNRPLTSAVAAFALATIAFVPAHAGQDRERNRFARHDGEAGERLAERHAERLTRALDLTEEQQTRLAALQDELGDALRPSLDAMRDTREALEQALDGANPDPATVGKHAIALHRGKETMQRAHEAFESGLEAMLTERQRTRYEAMRDAREERDGRFGPRGHRGHRGAPRGARD